MMATYRGEHATIERIVAENPAVVHEARRMWPKAIENAAAAGRPDNVLRYVRLGFDVHAAVQMMIGEGPNDWTALHRAVQQRDPDMVRLLLSLGADPRARSNRGGTVLDLARDTGQADLLDLLQG
jgi:Ankyrin repeats (many copies)